MCLYIFYLYIVHSLCVGSLTRSCRCTLNIIPDTRQLVIRANGLMTNWKRTGIEVCAFPKTTFWWRLKIKTRTIDQRTTKSSMLQARTFSTNNLFGNVALIVWDIRGTSGTTSDSWEKPSMGSLYIECTCVFIYVCNICI